MGPGNRAGPDIANPRNCARRSQIGAMCNSYEAHVAWRQYCDLMQRLELGVPTGQSEEDLPRVDDVRISDMAPVMRAAGNGIELIPMTFAFPPTGRSGPVF